MSRADYVSAETWAQWEAEMQQRIAEAREREEREREYEDYRLNAEDRRRLRGQLVAQEVVSRLQCDITNLREYVRKLEELLWECRPEVFVLAGYGDVQVVRCIALGLSLAGVQVEREGEVGQ